MCIDRIFNHFVQYLVQRCGTQLYLWNTFTLLDSISCHDKNVRILQSSKWWLALVLWIHNRIETRLYSATTGHECMSTKWLQWLVIGYRHVCITHLIGLSVRNFFYSENIHHPLTETEEIMDLTVFATLRRLHQFINLASFLYDCHLYTNRGCMVWKNLLFVV